MKARIFQIAGIAPTRAFAAELRRQASKRGAKAGWYDVKEPTQRHSGVRILMRTVDRTFGWLLVVGALLHAGGSWAGYRDTPELLLWALSGSLAALLLAALNLLRVGRSDDRGLAWVCLVGSLCWIVLALGFGAVIGNMLDPRAVIHAINALVLAAMSLRTLRQARGPVPSRMGA